MKALRYPILLSIAAALTTLALKSVAWRMTGSVAMLSDAMESGVNLLAALTAFFSLLYASRPADLTHTYGHEKIEYFSSGLEGSLIVAAGLGIIIAAIDRLFHPVDLYRLEIGTGISVVASVINLIVAQILLRVGRRHDSIVLEADGKHLMADVWTSVAVLLGVVLVWTTGVKWFDPAAAALAGLHIIWTGFDLIRRSFNGLMDHALSPQELATIRKAISERLVVGTTFHALRTRRAGLRRFADCHLLVPGNWTVQQAHDLGELIELAVEQAVPGLDLTVHIEPIDQQQSWEDSVLLHQEVAPPTAEPP